MSRPKLLCRSLGVIALALLGVLQDESSEDLSGLGMADDLVVQNLLGESQGIGSGNHASENPDRPHTRCPLNSTFGSAALKPARIFLVRSLSSGLGS